MAHVVVVWYIILTNMSAGGGDLTGTSGDIGAENWEIRWRGSQILKNVRIKSSPQTPSKIKKKIRSFFAKISPSPNSSRTRLS